MSAQLALFDFAPDGDLSILELAPAPFDLHRTRRGYTAPSLSIFEPKHLDPEAPWWWYRHGWWYVSGYETVWDQPGHHARAATCDLRCDTDASYLVEEQTHGRGRCQDVGHLLHVIVCTCGHTTPPSPDENAVVETFSDHHTPDWRELPALPLELNPNDPSKAQTRRREAWIAAHYGDRLPGTPIRTDRTAGGGRHVPQRSPWGGYDLAAAPIPRQPTMTKTLRDHLAAALSPGNDDTTAYAQADAVLITLGEFGITEYPRWSDPDATIVWLGPNVHLDTVTNRIWYHGDPFVQIGVEPYKGAE